MKLRFLSLILATALLASCGSKGNKGNSTEAATTSESGKVEFTALIENPAEFVNKTISVEGKVVHVCMHSGKKLFITGENPDVRLFIQAGEEMPKFPMDLLGSEVVVEGKLTSIVASAPVAAEGTHAGEGHQTMAAADTCETSKAMAAQPVLADMVMVYSKHSVLK